MHRAVIEVDPAKVVLIDLHYDQLLEMAIIVTGQRRIEIERGYLVFVEEGGDNLVGMLASKHCCDGLAARCQLAGLALERLNHRRPGERNRSQSMTRFKPSPTNV